MKKKLLLACVGLLSIIGITAQTQFPTISTNGAEVWYHIKVSRGAAANQLWLTGNIAGGQIKAQTFSNGNDQHWKVVNSGNGIALVNQEYGTYLNSDIDWSGASATSQIKATATAPTRALQMIASKIVSKAVCLANADATLNAAKDDYDYGTLKCLIYATQSQGGPIAYNNNTWNHSSVNFMTDADFLKMSILAATNVLDNSAQGNNPGQYSEESRTNLQYAIEAAQMELDDVNTTSARFMAAASELDAVVVSFKQTVILPKISSDTETTWYFIQGTRPANTYMTSPGAGTMIKDLAIVPDDTQLWKLVNGTNGFALQNKATGEYINTDLATGSNLPTQATIPANGLQFKVSNETTNKAARFWLENANGSTPALRLHAGGSGNAYGLMNWTGDANDNSSWLFFDYTEGLKFGLSEDIKAAKALYNSAIEGTILGQFTAASRTAYNTAISTAEALDLTTATSEQIIAAKDALKAAKTTFKCNTDTKTLVSDTHYKWFRIVNHAPVAYAQNKAMSSNGRALDGKFTFENIDVNSDAQLFRFELNDAGNATAIVNKANNFYVGTTGKILAAEEAGAEFVITLLDDISFWIKPTGNKPLHAAQSGTEILNWNSGAGSASAWRIEFVKDEEITDFTPFYTKAKAQAATILENTATAVGNEFGQYSTTVRDAYNSVVTTEAAKDPATMTAADMKTGIQTLKTALTSYVPSTDIKLLVADGKYKWFRIVNAASANVTYASGKAMSSNGRLENEKFTYEDLDVTSDAQLFRFELNAGKTAAMNIVNKASGKFVGVDGMILTASTPGNEFEIKQLAGGRSFWIDPTLVDNTDPANPAPYAPLHAAAANVEILNWDAGAGSASAWYIEFVKDEATAVSAVKADKYTIRTNNGVITVDGVKNFEVYSAVGQKQNNKAAQKKGVYLVKINNTTHKVVVE